MSKMISPPPFRITGHREPTPEDRKEAEEMRKSFEYNVIPSEQWWQDNAAHLNLPDFDEMIAKLKAVKKHTPLSFVNIEVMSIRAAIPDEEITVLTGMRMWSTYRLEEGDFVFTTNCGVYKTGILSLPEKKDLLKNYIMVDEGVYRPKGFAKPLQFIRAPYPLKYQSVINGQNIMHIVKIGHFLCLDDKHKTYRPHEMQERFAPIDMTARAVFNTLKTREY